MKTTLEIPDAIFRRAKARAGEQGIPLRRFVTEAVSEKLKSPRRKADRASLAGRLRYLGRDNARIRRRIEQEFETIEPEDRA